MVEEDYVSYETAKLLKEKGFDAENVSKIGGYYIDHYHTGQYVSIDTKSMMLNKTLEDWEYLRPTLQMARKWLWQEHKLHVEPTMTIEKLGFTFLNKWHCFVMRVDNKNQTNLKCIGEDFGSYEEACEFGIKYCLEKLI